MGAESHPTALTGAQPFGKYYLLDRIGAGGMAEVFLAVSIGLEGFQHTLVIKRMLPHLSQDAAFVRMFIDEAKLSGLLAHPNIVQISEFGKVGDSFFIAMEHVNGQTLSAVQARLAAVRRRAPVAAALEIARQVCLGLHYAHSLQSPTGQPLGVVHRDISPSNLMLSFHGGVKILDFGIARVAEGLRDSQTQVGTLKGKVGYMAPEQIRLERVDGRCDIFALGIVLHETLTQRRLFRATTEHTAAQLVLESPIPIPSSVNPEISFAVDQIVMRALERNPEARYQTAAEMADDIEQALLRMRASSHEPQRLLQSLFTPPPSHAGEVPLPALPAGMPVPEVPRDLEKGTVASPMRRRSRRARSVLIILAALAVGGGAVAVRGRIPALVRRLVNPLAWRVQTPDVAPPSPTAPLPVAVRVSLDSNPQDAEVVREDSGQMVGRTPVTVVLSQAHDVIVFRFEKPGYFAARNKVIPDLDKAVRVDLRAEPVAQGPQPEPARTVPPSPRHHRRAINGAGATASASSAAGEARVCVLSVASFPWTELWIDGKDTGQRTPVVHFGVTCGAHRLALRRRDLKLDRIETVTLVPGQELKKHYELGDDYGE